MSADEKMTPEPRLTNYDIDRFEREIRFVNSDDYDGLSEIGPRIVAEIRASRLREERVRELLDNYAGCADVYLSRSAVMFDLRAALGTEAER